jgi:tripartite-type tricarboxylate transporter receptor subunit TctC
MFSVIPQFRAFMVLAFGVAALVTPSALHAGPAKAWPDRTVRLLTPFGAGGGSDSIARLIADQLSRRWGQPVIVENKPGADGILAASEFTQSGDSHLLLFTFTSIVTVNPITHLKLPYDPAELLPVSPVVDGTITVVTNNATGINSLSDLVETARAKPGLLNFATVPGGGHFGFLDFQRRAGISLTLVPYRNPIASVTDLMENRIQVAVMPLSIVLAQVQAGKLKLLCVAGDTRSPAVPDVPTTREAGAAEFRVLGGLGLFAGKDSPPELREKIARDIIDIVHDPVISDRIASLGESPRSAPPKEFAANLADQVAWYTGIAAANGLKPQP